MMSQTHVLLAGALLARPGQPLRNTAVVLGAFVPDLAIYTLFAWSKAAGIPEKRVWDELYWQPPWSEWVAAGNSIPIYAALLLIGLVVLRAVPGAFRIGAFATFFALAALVHIAGDLPVHVEDAHRHLWPLSDWRFVSPVSYWNPDHHGRAFAFFEAALGMTLCFVLFRRFRALWLRVL
ncbi:hypothetical protein N9H93_05040, partial [Rhizobiaceae bacterium]|nr:hypothetical protein [Rhizobiaceae bacterium]